MSSPTHIYELVDVTFDDAYFTVGVFDTLKKAEAYLLSQDRPVNDHGVCDDWFSYEIRKRELNKVSGTEADEVVRRYNLIDTYDEEKDENFWKLEEVQNG